jgi:hypothetical protein
VFTGPEVDGDQVVSVAVGAVVGAVVGCGVVVGGLEGLNVDVGATGAVGVEMTTGGPPGGVERSAVPQATATSTTASTTPVGLTNLVTTAPTPSRVQPDDIHREAYTYLDTSR